MSTEACNCGCSTPSVTALTTKEAEPCACGCECCEQDEKAAEIAAR